LAESRLKSQAGHTSSSGEITEITVKEALKKKIIKTEWQAVFMALAQRLLIALGVPAENQRFIEKFPWERAHYSLQSFDQEVMLERWGWTEVSGHSNRTDYDLKSHMQFTGADMQVFKEYEKPVEKEQLLVKPQMAKLGPVFKKEAERVGEIIARADPEEVETGFKEKGHFMVGEYKILPEHVYFSREKVVEHGRRFIPNVVEPSFGLDRLLYVVLEYAYRVKDDRAVLSFPRDIAPIQVGVYPLVNKDGLPEKTSGVHKKLLDEGFIVEYDEAGSIGRRYARADEVGIPLGITVDYDTLRDDTVTIRDRDSWKQVRTRIEDLPRLLHDYFRQKIGFEELGKLIED
jgi:glycyl-tRNA synthetase